MRRLVLISIGLVLSCGAYADPHKITPDADANTNANCACVAATTGCTSNLFDNIAGKERQTWTQEIHLKQGKEVDLSEACFRKRDSQYGGAGLCCSTGKADDVNANIRFYWGDLQ